MGDSEDSSAAKERVGLELCLPPLNSENECRGRLVLAVKGQSCDPLAGQRHQLSCEFVEWYFTLHRWRDLNSRPHP